MQRWTAVDWLGPRPDQVLIVDAHPWDLYGVMRAGFHTAFVPRSGEWGEPETPDLTPPPDLNIAVRDFPELATRLGA